MFGLILGDPYHRTKTPTNEKIKYTNNQSIMDGDVSVRSTYLDHSYTGDPLLMVEFSLPKLLYGNNYQMIDNIQEAIEIANEKLALVPYLPPLDIGKGVLNRLDYCYNYQVGDLVSYYINAISRLSYPHRRTKPHPSEGVQFQSKHKTTKFYDKQRECGYTEASGILRQETTIMTSKQVAKFIGKDKPTLHDVDEQWLKNELLKELENLHLKDNPIPAPDQALKILCDLYGSKAGMYYFGLLMSRMSKSKELITLETEMHPRSLDRQLRKIVDANMPLTLSDHDKELPPLEISS